MAKLIPVLYLSPVFNDLTDKVSSLLQRRFVFHEINETNALETLDQIKTPFILLGNATLFETFLNQNSQLDFHALLQIETESEISLDWLSNETLSQYFFGPPSPQKLVFECNRIYSKITAQNEIKKLSQHVEVHRNRLQDLNEIGTALSTERNLDKLLQKILRSSMEITSSDSGSLYLVEDNNEGTQNSKDPMNGKCLRFKLANNVSLDIDFSEFTVDINEKSIAGFVALSGKPLNIENVSQIGSTYPFRFNKSFDENTGYESRSMLTVPMRNPKGEVIGILQMINKNKDWLIPLSLKNPAELEEQILIYDLEDESLLSSLASQAAVAIENARLYEAIQNLFEGFIKASVKAIESRDPTTSGHSERVAILTVGLAKELDGISTGRFKEVSFSRQDLKEIQYASLLHDFGKIGVRENVLIKSEKLYPDELKSIKHRFQLIRKNLENDYLKRKVNFLLGSEHTKSNQVFHELDKEMQSSLDELDGDLGMILQANRPSILAEEVSLKLKEIQQKLFLIDEQETALINPIELSRLSIMKGTLDASERKEIEYHVTHTYHFLKQIPWTNELRQVPQIAYAHHEKLNGKGYPRNLPAEEIPIQSKMMTIADIYDALTASDRPYKKALPASRALDILGYEVKDGMLDPDLYQIFIDGKVYEEIKS